MVIVFIYLEEMYIKTKYFLLSVWYSQSNSMVNVFGASTGEEGGLGNLQVLRKVIAIGGKYGDYFKEIQVSHKLGYPAYRIAPEGSLTFVFTYENKVFCLGAHQQHMYIGKKIAVVEVIEVIEVIEEFKVNVTLRVEQDPWMKKEFDVILVHLGELESREIGVDGLSGLKGERGVAGLQVGKGNVGLHGPKGEQGV